MKNIINRIFNRRPKFWDSINKDYEANIQRQQAFQKLVEKTVPCPDCGQKQMKLGTYKNDVDKREYEILVGCNKCGFTLLLRHDGVMAEHAYRPVKPKNE